jgi:monoamine oxidase
MALAAGADTVGDRQGLRSCAAEQQPATVLLSGFLEIAQGIGGPHDNSIKNETRIVARTPFLQFLQTLSSDVRLCEARDISVAELMAERLAAPSRRQFVAGAAAMAASAAAAGAAHAAPSKMRIAIVGAGIAGLNAALTLQDAGVASTVYEASNRIGGRMFSATSIWADNQVSEWCGELIDSDHETIIGLARRFGLPLEDFAGNPSLRDTYKLFGRYYTVQQAYEDWRGGVQQAIAKDLEAAGESTTYDRFMPEGRKLDQMSVAEWIDSRVPGGRKSPIGALLDVAYAIEYGADTSDQSALNIVYLLGANKQTAAGEGFNVFGASDERYHIRGGNQQLPTRIARHLRTPVQLGMRMISIARNGDGAYALGFDGHPSVAADLVILSLPFAVLRKIDTSGAGFDARKTTAIEELGRGQSGKLQLQFASRYWREPGPWPGRGNGLSYTDEGYQNTWEVSRRQAGASGILNNYTGGSATAAKTAKAPFATAADANVQEDAKAFLGGLETVFPGGTAKWNGRAASSLPALDPNMGASYSYWRVGQYTSFAGYEKARQGNIFFAGEHCSADYQGFMEGGAAEGARAAKEILAQLAGKTGP